MIREDQVPWVAKGSAAHPIDHAVSGYKSGWITTSCGVFTPSWRALTMPPSRRCRACVAALKLAMPAPGQAEALVAWHEMVNRERRT